MATDHPASYLTDDEELRLRWRGELRSEDGRREAEFVATDRRLLSVGADGFRDLRYDDVSSIEAEDATEVSVEGVDYRLVIGGGVLLASLAFLGAVVAPPGLASLALVVGSVGGLGAAEWGWLNRERFDGFRRTERPVQHITIVTSGERRHRFTVPPDDGIAAKLSRLVRGTR